MDDAHPKPGSPEEERAFAKLQALFAAEYDATFSDPLVPRTVVVVPSLTLDLEELSKIDGVHHYEERMLCLLLLLKLPRTSVIFVTSQALQPAIVDYYLHLLPGVPSAHARRRLTLLDCDDGSARPLTEKILERPRLVERIRSAIVSPRTSHMTCFVATPLERTLAVRLGIPMYNADPGLRRLGSKSGARELFRSAGVNTPEGFEDLRDEDDLSGALTELKATTPAMHSAVVKLNEGFSGEGNALFHFDDDVQRPSLAAWVRRTLPQQLRFAADGETYGNYIAKFESMGGIAERFIDAVDKRSPSVQYRIDPLGNPAVLSTHDQLLGGPSGQVYLGCTFPAAGAYRLAVQGHASRVADALAAAGVIGRFSVDFVSAAENEAWEHYAIEVNLRKGGTTLPYLMLDFLTNGTYDPASGLYRNQMGQPRFYVASDTVQSPSYRGLTPDDLLDIALCSNLHFDAAAQQGVAFHLMGALSEFGKFGMVAIGDSPESAVRLYEKTISILNRETEGQRDFSGTAAP
jgi:PGM1 C-terminal domain